MGVVSIILTFALALPLFILALLVNLVAALFKLAWWIVGIVIMATLARGDYDCSQQCAPVWKMSIAQLVFLGFAVCGHLGGLCSKSK